MNIGLSSSLIHATVQFDGLYVPPTIIGKCPGTILPKDSLQKEILPNGHFADGHFVKRTFCRTDSMTNGLFAEKTFCRK